MEDAYRLPIISIAWTGLELRIPSLKLVLSQKRLEDELIELELVEKGIYPVYKLEKAGPY